MRRDTGNTLWGYKIIEDDAVKNAAFTLGAHISQYPPKHIVFNGEEAPKIIGRALPPGCYAVIITNDGHRKLYAVDEQANYHQIFEEGLNDN